MVPLGFPLGFPLGYFPLGFPFGFPLGFLVYYVRSSNNRKLELSSKL